MDTIEKDGQVTGAELAEMYSISPDTMRKRIGRTFGQGHDMETPLTHGQAQQVSYSTRKKGGAIVRDKRTMKKRTPAADTVFVHTENNSSTEPVNHSPAPAEPKNQLVPPAKKPNWNWEEIFIFIASLLITLVSIALTITGLYIFANWAGLGLGGMFSLFLLITVTVARNRQKGFTSIQALETVIFLEAGAGVLHCFTFWRLLPAFDEGWLPARIILCIALAAFAAYLSYNAVLTVRTYNAEVPD